MGDIMYKYILQKGIRIKIIGDSIAAGAGSSMSYKTDELIFEDNETKFYKRVAPNSWWGLLEQYLKENYANCILDNNGCGGAFSYQINKHLDTLVSGDDGLVLVLMGLNDRKRKNGIEELMDNCNEIVNQLTRDGKIVILLTPNPSSTENEYYPNRLYHTSEIVGVLRKVAEEKGIKLIDNYKYVGKYLKNNNLAIENVICGNGCMNDGAHPSDMVQKLMFQNVIEALGI
jgi:lysophospholipase L1-like esterase